MSYHWLETTKWLGNSGLAWISAGAFTLVFFVVFYGAARIIAARCTRLAQRRPQSTLLHILAAVMDATRGWLLLLLGVVLGLVSLDLTSLYDKTGVVLTWCTVALIGIQVALWVSTALVGWLKRATPDGSMQKSNPIIYGILTWTVELLVWVTLLLILLSQAGVHIGAFIASLGVGGIAIAMAAKNVLEDLFASIAIGLDKPFMEGDYIAFGSDSGTVVRVGIKSTRIQSLSGEEIAISNSNLLQNLSHNYNRMTERRIAFSISTLLDTPREKVPQVTQAVNDIIDSQEGVRRDRGFFMAIEKDGLRFDFVYYVLDPGYAAYCTAQEQINLRIMEAVEKLGVGFAMPMRMMRDARGNVDTVQDTDD